MMEKDNKKLKEIKINNIFDIKVGYYYKHRVHSSPLPINKITRVNKKVINLFTSGRLGCTAIKNFTIKEFTFYKSCKDVKKISNQINYKFLKQ